MIYQQYHSPFLRAEIFESIAYKMSFHSGFLSWFEAQKKEKVAGFQVHPNTVIKKGTEGRAYLKFFSLSEAEQNMLT